MEGAGVTLDRIRTSLGVSVSRPEGLLVAVEELEFEELYAATRPRVLGYLLRRTSNPADAADALAETYIVAWRRRSDLPSGEAVLPWLLGVARRVLANQARGERRRSALAERLRADIVADGERAQRPVGDGPSAHAIAAAFGRLKPADQELLALVGWEHLDRDQIAVVLGCSRALIRVRLHRSRQRFARELASEGITVSTPLSTYDPVRESS